MTQAQQKQQYTKNYQQIRLIGRGSYGSAFLVRNNIDGLFYVAKKLMLEGMSQKDAASAWGQIEILKKFNDLRIPFIVEYIECFNFEKTLIIIIEYCQHGDLATFLKNWKKKGELLDQKIIVNWFIQLLFGVKALHSKNVLHRDLKGANVFLTSNKTLKIGDFGISKVLDNTSAKTFVGTPYYLSPEVCENRPYNLASDLWSLGCIIYEMCTLNYPFQASNLLGLAMKILTDEVKPISPHYSKELNLIIMKLFIKDEKKRITINEILQSPIIKAHMKTFVQDQEDICKMINLGKRNRQDEEKQQQFSNGNGNTQQTNEQTMKTINSVMQNTKGSNEGTLSYSQSLTPKQRLQLKKEQEIRKRQQQLKQAALNLASLRNFAKQKKYETLASSGSGFHQTGISTNNLQRQFQSQNKQKAEFMKTRNRLEKMHVINTEQLCQTLNKIKQTMKGSQVNLQNLPQNLNEEISLLTIGTIKRALPIHSNAQTISKNIISPDERPIKTKNNGHYQIDEEIQDYYELQEYYDEEFQDYIDEPLHKNTATRQQFEEIKAFYEHQAGEDQTMSPTKKKKIAETFKNEKIQAASTPSKKVNLKEEECKGLVGEKRYKELYKLVEGLKIDHKTLKKEYNASQIKAIKLIDQIIYLKME